ncbi:thioredoxin domain-containing protein 15 [Cephus cinctus]|uniref:Thioredoxin domain-containing protein 15 n=1 Tax=Cephus cinctus TaxID=211228 RepID=A0AAJ7RJB2_CEPCN|nr:thioredoxin domain-containing protein 15 [Cephus cinctus]
MHPKKFSLPPIVLVSILSFCLCEESLSPLLDGIQSLEVKAISKDSDTELINNTGESVIENEEIDTTEPQAEGNLSDANSTIPESASPNVTKVNCLVDKKYSSVELVNATRLMELLILEPGPSNRTKNSKEGRQVPGTCVLVLFYARWCVFSSLAAPHFNVLPNFFSPLKTVAIDAIKYPNFNAQYGIVGVPTLILVHNGKPVVKFNGTVYTLEAFARFISYFTTLEPKGSMYLTSAVFNGPVPSTPSNETDYCLVLSWAFIAVCALYFTSQSRWWRQFVELIQNTWRESNAQHEHTD